MSVRECFISLQEYLRESLKCPEFLDIWTLKRSKLRAQRGPVNSCKFSHFGTTQRHKSLKKCLFLRENSLFKDLVHNCTLLNSLKYSCKFSHFVDILREFPRLNKEPVMMPEILINHQYDGSQST